jgi:hypothetical protein
MGRTLLVPFSRLGYREGNTRSQDYTMYWFELRAFEASGSLLLKMGNARS